MVDILKYINNLMNELKLPYTLDGWDADLELPHWIGEISETPTLDEDGKSEYSFILTGFDTSLSKLYKVSETLKTKFKYGHKVNGMVIIYDNTLNIQTDVEGAKQIQINLKIKKWSV